MTSKVSVSILKPHPKNQEYFSDLPDEKYREIKRSIEAHGIRDPLKVLPDYTVVAGHQRLKIALDLGLRKVPVEILDVTSDEAEYLLIADNEERRQADDDPVKKARRAKFLAEYWGMRKGATNPKGTIVSRQGNNYPDDRKTLDDVAEAIGESRENLKKILKLNDLIEPLQKLVSAERLGRTAAYSLAFLPPEEQEELLGVLGESGVCGLSVKDARKLRAELDSARQEKDELRSQVIELEEEKRSLSGQLADLRDSLSSAEEKAAERLGRQYEEKLQQAVSDLERKLEEKRAEAENLRAKLRELKRTPVEKVVEKVVYETDPLVEAELEAARKQAAELAKEKESLQARFRAVAREKEKKEVKLREAEDRSAELEKHVAHIKQELNKLKSKPRPRLDQKRADCHALMEKACTSAFALADGLKTLEEEYGDELVSIARVRGGQEVEEVATSVLDAGFFKMFDLALESAVARIDRIADLLRPGRPKLQVVKRPEPQ